MKTETTVSTKVTKDAEAPIKTALTIDWDGMTDDDTRALAQSAMIVKWQGRARTNGIPTEETIKATDYRVGTRTLRKVLTPDEIIANLSAEDRAALIAKLSAMV